LHPASIFHEDDAEKLAALVDERGFALIIGADGQRPVVAHAPVLLAGDRLRFHLSAANCLCQVLRANPWVLAVITGPDAYVSPDWYAVAGQVPTWNYLAAEMEGSARAMTRRETMRLVDDLSAHFEARLAPKPPWTSAKLVPRKLEAMLDAILGFEMRVERRSGVTKLSQNKSAASVASAARHLRGRKDEGSRRIARLMERAAKDA
jgi:transcriptional regulator